MPKGLKEDRVFVQCARLLIASSVKSSSIILSMYVQCAPPWLPARIGCKSTKLAVAFTIFPIKTNSRSTNFSMEPLVRMNVPNGWLQWDYDTLRPEMKRKRQQHIGASTVNAKNTEVNSSLHFSFIPRLSHFTNPILPTCRCALSQWQNNY